MIYANAIQGLCPNYSESTETDSVYQSRVTEPNGVCRGTAAGKQQEGEMAQSRRERLQKQRERQRAYRAAGKEMRKPSRDDVARALLHWAVTENIRHGREKELFRLQRHIIDQLVVQGFDGQACDAAFDDLVDKYRAGWAFRRKPHLQSRNGDEDGDG